MARTFAIVSILVAIIISAVASKPHPSLAKRFPIKNHLGPKMARLHFYFHDTVSGPNPTAVRVVLPTKQSLSAFGMVMMMDDPLTEGPDSSSPAVGRAQGMYAGADQSEIGFLMNMNLVFTAGKYRGSVLTVLGHNAVLHAVREMPVVGGTGRLRFARGYALARTHWLDLKTGDAVVEYNVTVVHY